MDWTAIGAIGELTGALAVVVSLVYVGRQVRQSAQTAAIQGVETLTSTYAQYGFTVAADPDLSALMFRIQFRGLRLEDLTEVERSQIGHLFNSILSIQLTMWERWRTGAIDRELRDSYLVRTSGLFATLYFGDVWPYLRPNFPAEFATFVEETYLPPGS